MPITEVLFLNISDVHLWGKSRMSMSTMDNTVRLRSRLLWSCRSDKASW